MAQNNNNNDTSSSARGAGMVDLGIFRVPHPRIWSTTDPQLHTVSVDLDRSIWIGRLGWCGCNRMLWFADLGCGSSQQSHSIECQSRKIGGMEPSHAMARYSGFSHECSNGCRHATSSECTYQINRKQIEYVVGVLCITCNRRGKFLRLSPKTEPLGSLHTKIPIHWLGF